MFGVVPRPLWEKLTPPDERNRIQLAMRPLLVEASWGRMMVDCGAGDKMGREAGRHLRARSQPLARPGVGEMSASTSESIDFALATHLHFDHFGGATMLVDGGAACRVSARPDI